MLAIFAALMAAFFFSLTTYMTRLGLETTPGAVVLVSAWVNILTFATIFFVVLPARLLVSAAVLPFLAAGIAIG